MCRGDELPPRRRRGSRAPTWPAGTGDAHHPRARRSANPGFDLAGARSAGAGAWSRAAFGKRAFGLSRRRDISSLFASRTVIAPHFTEHRTDQGSELVTAKPSAAVGAERRFLRENPGCHGGSRSRALQEFLRASAAAPGCETPSSPDRRRRLTRAVSEVRRCPEEKQSRNSAFGRSARLSSWFITSLIAGEPPALHTRFARVGPASRSTSNELCWAHSSFHGVGIVELGDA